MSIPKKGNLLSLPSFTLDGTAKTWRSLPNPLNDATIPLLWLEHHFTDHGGSAPEYKGTKAPSKGRLIRPPSTVIASFNITEYPDFLLPLEDAANERGTIIGNDIFRHYENSPTAGVPRDLTHGGPLAVNKWIAGDVCVITEYGGLTSNSAHHNYTFQPTAGNASQCAGVGLHVGGTQPTIVTSVLDVTTYAPNSSGLSEIAFMLTALERFNRLLVIYVDYTNVVNFSAPNSGFYCQDLPLPLHGTTITRITGSGVVGNTQSWIDSEKAAMETLVAPLGDSAMVLHKPTPTELGEIVRDWILDGM